MAGPYLLGRYGRRWRRLLRQLPAAEQGVLFMVLAVNVEYKAPARLDDRLLVTCEALPDGRTTVIFQQRIYKEPAAAGAERELLIEATVRVVCLDGRTMRPRRIAGYVP